jgi:hypothetical protein
MVALESFLRRGERVLVKHIADACVLLHLETGQYYALNDVGGEVWALCDGGHSVAGIISIISQAYDAPREVIEADVLEILQEFVNEQLAVEAQRPVGDAEATA